MALSWNEIRSRAITFSKEWADESRENAESQSFWNDFFDVFGVARKRVSTFEKPVQKLGDKKGSIDLLWKGVILVEYSFCLDCIKNSEEYYNFKCYCINNLIITR